MRPLIDFTNPMSVLTAAALFVLVMLLAKETKKSVIPAIMLGIFVIIIAGHSVELSMTNKDLIQMQETIAKCITYDFVFILLSFFSYLWIDDIESKENKRKSIDDSLAWFWSKV